MKAKVDRDKLSTELQTYKVPVAMSDQSLYDLALQKLALQRAIENADEDLFPGESDKLTGILHLIDHIQDDIANRPWKDEKIVFPLSEDGEYEVKEPTED